MLGERSNQRGLWEADRLYLDHVGRDTFYGLLASLQGRLFRDADFAEFYCADNGRNSIPRRRVCPVGNGVHVAFAVPARKRVRHVWTY